MLTFEEKVSQAVKSAVIKQAGEARYVEPWSQHKKALPIDVIDSVWDAIDWREVVQDVSAIVKERLVASIAQSMLTETKNDVKKLLSIQGVREKLRAEAYPKILEAIEASSD